MRIASGRAQDGHDQRATPAAKRTDFSGSPPRSSAPAGRRRAGRGRPTRSLDQHDIPGRELGAQQGARPRRRRARARDSSPRAPPARRRRRGCLPRRARRRRAGRHPTAAARARVASCSARGRRPELGHLPRAPPDPPPAPARPTTSGLERGPHRLGVGVVGVVDDGHAVGAVGDLHPPAAARRRRPTAAAATASSGRPSASAAAAAASALATWCSPSRPQRHRALVPRRRPGEPRRGRVVERDVLGPHVGVGRRPKVATARAGAGRPSPSTSGSSALSTAMPSAGEGLDQLALGRGDRLARCRTRRGGPCRR